MNHYINPHVYQGDPGNAPEFASDNPIECSECLEDFDRDDDPMYVVDGKDVCRDCIEYCAICGSLIDDDHKDLGPVVKYREYENNGKLSGFTHAPCAAEYLCDLLELEERCA